MRLREERKRYRDPSVSPAERSELTVLGELVPGPDIQPVDQRSNPRSRKVSIRNKLNYEKESVQNPSDIQFSESLEEFGVD
ncbi:MAG: hypothetical protein ABEJ99_04450 [Candidatus Nanohaloarchaea archaeon]